MFKILLFIVIINLTKGFEDGDNMKRNDQMLLEKKYRSSDLELTYETVSNLASLPLHCHNVEYPNKLNQVLESQSDLLSPSDLHPIFYGCFDWRSSVHGHWLLARAASLFPDSQLSSNVTQVFNSQFTKEKVTKEKEYFNTTFGSSWERTYGWAWLLRLQQDLASLCSGCWSDVLDPLAVSIRDLYLDFLPKLVYPIRVGEHTNTAFGLSLALDYARSVGHQELENLINLNASQFYSGDKECPLHYEPSGFDFLSPCLQEADLMARVIKDNSEFRNWLFQFLPSLFSPDYQLEPGHVIDRTDGKLVHLDGLNFSRAWALYNIATRLMDTGDVDMALRLLEMGDNHVRASIEFVVGSDYAGSHWLATFLMFALEKRQELSKML